MKKRTLTLGHSPDPDDAFMFYGLAAGKVDGRGWQFEHVLQDIQTLNERAKRGELDITAISIHAYPFVADKYALTNCGASIGDGYGPKIVTREDSITPETLCEHGRVIGVPGEMTTAFLALNLFLGRGKFRHKVVMFDRIIDEVLAGNIDAGLIIHEGQLTYAKQELHQVVDLGRWWQQRTALPLPLGGNCIRRDLGQEAMSEVTAVLKTSIQYGLEHRKEAVEYALKFGRGLDLGLADQFIGMYVNDYTLDYGDVGRRAIRELLRMAHEIGMVPPTPTIDFV